MEKNHAIHLLTELIKKNGQQRHADALKALTEEGKPSDFIVTPYGSVGRTSEAETVAQNIMTILKRTGDTFRPLSWEEYKEERKKDWNFSELEEGYFNNVIDFCKSEATARLFSPAWEKV